MEQFFVNSDEEIALRKGKLEAIHECVRHSIPLHVINFPLDIILEYFATYPFFRGADMLYFLVLEREGEKAHYSSEGRHLVDIQPELMGVYMLADQNINASIIKGGSGNTISSSINLYVGRAITCKDYQLRNSIITGEISFDQSFTIPSLALNIPIYRKVYGYYHENQHIQNCLVVHDCLEMFTKLDRNLIRMIIDRIAFVKCCAPNLWREVLCNYYEQYFITNNLLSKVQYISIRFLIALDNFFPNLINLPNGLNTTELRIWFSSPLARMYLLGMDMGNELVSEDLVSERLLLLKNLGIERFSQEITGIKLDDERKIIGKIGMVDYPMLKNKRLMINKDLAGVPLDWYYPHDLFPLIDEDDVIIISYRDLSSCDGDYDKLVDMLTNTTVRQVDIEEIALIMGWFEHDFGVTRGIPVRVKLVELMAGDMVNY